MDASYTQNLACNFLLIPKTNDQCKQTEKVACIFCFSRSEILRHQNSNLYYHTKNFKTVTQDKKEHNVVLISIMYFPRYLPWVKSKYRFQTNWFKIEFCPCLYTYPLLTRSTLHEQKSLLKIQTLLINGRQSGMQTNPPSEQVSQYKYSPYPLPTEFSLH